MAAGLAAGFSAAGFFSAAGVDLFLRASLTVPDAPVAVLVNETHVILFI